jgi:hypothetical protein
LHKSATVFAGERPIPLYFPSPMGKGEYNNKRGYDLPPFLVPVAM